jgi:hypothetical protein
MDGLRQGAGASCPSLMLVGATAAEESRAFLDFDVASGWRR